MCIILYNETGKLYDKEALSIAYDNNPHGMGLMWVEDGKVEVLRGLFTKKKMFEILGHFEHVPHALHLRWRTRGKIDKSLCHPFRASHQGADKPVFLMHNGTFMDLKPNEGQSDTALFATNMQKITEEYDTDMLFNESFLRRMEKQIMSFNKVIFLRSDGKVSIMNPNEWTVLNGIWVSNTYSLQDGYRKAKVARSLYSKWSRYSSSAQSSKGPASGGSKGSSSAQSRRTPVGGKDWLAKSQEWELAQKRAKEAEKLAAEIDAAYDARALELGRSLTKKERKKIRKTVRRQHEARVERAKAEREKTKAERELLKKKQFDRMFKDAKDEPEVATAKPGPGRVLRRRRLPDGSVEEVELRPGRESVRYLKGDSLR